MDAFIEFMKWFALAWVLFGIFVLYRRIQRERRNRKELKKKKAMTTTTTTPPYPPIVIPSNLDIFVNAVSSTSGSEQSTYTMPYIPDPDKESKEEE